MFLTWTFEFFAILWFSWVVHADNRPGIKIGRNEKRDRIADAFYKAPRGFESAKPGTILNYRRVPNPITIDNINPINLQGAWQLLYRTQNSVGEPIATVVTVLVPFNAKSGNLFAESFFAVLATGFKYNYN